MVVQRFVPPSTLLWMLLTIAPGCEDVPTVSLAVGSSGGSSDGSASSAADDAEALIDEASAWPDGWLGVYYLDLGFPLPPARYIGNLESLELRRDELLVTHIGCTGERHVERFAVSIEGGEAFVLPEPEQRWLRWNGIAVAEALVLRPAGDACDRLVSEFLDPTSPSSGFVDPWSWRRGTVYVTDVCEGEHGVWGADASPPQAWDGCPIPAAD